MEILAEPRTKSTMVPDQAEVLIRREGIKILKTAACLCTADRLATKLVNIPDSKWAGLQVFTLSAHVIAQVEKRLDLPAFFWDSYLVWAQESLRKWVMDGIMPDFPPFVLESVNVVLKLDPSLPEEIACKETRVLSAAAIKAFLEILNYISFQNLNQESIEFLLGLSANEATQNLSQIQRDILVGLRLKTDALKIDKGKWKGWLLPNERTVEWHPWEDFIYNEWFKEPTASKRAALSRSLRNLEDRGLIDRQTKKGTKQSASQKHTTHVALTELGYLAAKMLISQESYDLPQVD